MRQGSVSAKRWTYGFVFSVFTQFFLTQWGTYVAYSWDIVEPITCCMGFSDTLIAFIFFVNTGRIWDMEGLANYFKGKKFESIIKKKGFDMRKIDETHRAIKVIEKRLEELSCD